MNVRRVVGNTLIIVLVTSALILTSFRVLLPQLNSQHQLLRQKISATLNLPVEFSEVGVRLAGFSPEITLSEVVIQSAHSDRSILEFDQLLLRFSILRSLLSGQPAVELLTITGPEFGMIREAKQLRVVGLQAENGGNQGQTDELTNWLLAQQRLQIFDARIHYEDRNRQLNLDVGVSSIQLQSVATGVELSGRLRVVGDITGNLEVTGSTKATDAEGLLDASWNMYLDIRELKLGDVVDRKMQIGGKFALQGWLYGSGLSLSHIDGGLQWKNLSLSKNSVLGDLKGDLFRSRFSWNSMVHGWRGRLHELEFSSPAGQWSGREMSAYRDGDVLRVDGGDIDLQVTAHLMSLFFDEDDSRRKMVVDLAPSGVINLLQFDLQQLESRQWNLSGLVVDFDRVGFSGYEKIPAVYGLSGLLAITGSSGKLALNSATVGIQAPEIFPEKFSFDRLSADLNWRDSGSGTTVDWTHLSIANKDLAINSRGRLQFQREQSPILKMVLGLDRFDIAQVSHYLPASVIPAGAVRWVNGALLSGQLVDTGLLWNGKVEDFPYTQSSEVEGLFLVSGKVEQAALNYVPGSSFPSITDLDASLQVLGLRLQIDGHQGFIYDSELSDVTAVIENLASRKNHVKVTGRVDGPLTNALRYLTETPLKKNVGRFVKDLTVTGSSQLELDLDIPFKKGGDLKTDGLLRLQGNQLDFAETRISLKDVVGQLRFDKRGIYGSELATNLFGGAAMINIDTGVAKGSLSTVSQRGLMIDGTGTLDLEAVTEYLHWSGFQVGSGEASWVSSLSFFNGDMDLKVAADLNMAAIELPPPLRKRVSEPGVLQLNLFCHCTDRDSPLNLSSILDNQWYVDLELARGSKNPGIIRGVVSGMQAAELPEWGVLLTGQLPDVDFGLWQQWIAALPSREGTGAGIDQVDVRIEQLRLFGQRFPGIEVSGDFDGNDWGLELASAEALGQLRYQPNPGFLELDFKKLSLFSSNSEGPGLSVSGFSDIPQLDVTVDNLLFNGAPLGQLALYAQTAGSGELVFNNIRLDSKHSRLNGRGVWAIDVAGEVNDTGHSYFQGKLETDNFGDALAMLGQPQAVSGGTGDASWDLTWPGGPHAFSLDHISGDLSLNMSDGSLMGLEPGFGRLFGLLSVDSFQRRMTLDFRDLVGTGFALDKLQTKLTTLDGQLKLSTLKLKGPAADIKVTGDIGLEGMRLSLTAEVVPKITESLPLAVTIGSPGLGAAIFIGQKLLGNRINDVTARTYRITGSADEPVVELAEGNVWKKLLDASGLSNQSRD